MMFGWFKRKTEPTAIERLAEAIPRILPAYGDLMERYPLAILDTSKLPVSKGDMKLALKIAWLTNTDPKMRNAVENGYMHLSQFQDSVGEKPIDPSLPENADPTESSAILEPYLAISGKVSRESESLLIEFADFKRRGTLP